MGACYLTNLSRIGGLLGGHYHVQNWEWTYTHAQSEDLAAFPWHAPPPTALETSELEICSLGSESDTAT